MMLTPWEPVCEDSPSRRLSAPSPWLCAVTDVGRCRSSNEDEYFLSPDSRLWVLADGMGGHASGEIASALTIQAIITSMGLAGLGAAAGNGVCICDRLMKAFAIAQDWVSSRSLMFDDCRGMGSTVIAGVVDNDSLYVCHVGDVRGYHLSDDRFRRVTDDHSWVWENLVMSGLLTPDKARSHPQRRVVTQAIGGLRGIRPEIARVTLAAGDRVLLCSDGLWEALADEDIEAVLASDGSMRELASVLVDRANAAGGSDNITAILYEHGGKEAAAVS